MHKNKKVLSICKTLVVFIVLLVSFALLILCSLRDFSDYYLNTWELVLLCTIGAVIIKAMINRYVKEKQAYKKDVKQLNGFNKELGYLKRSLDTNEKRNSR